MSNVWIVRAVGGRYTEAFVNNGYAAIGWVEEYDLSELSTRDAIEQLYRTAYPEETSPAVIGQQVGQIFRFRSEIKIGDFIITPAADTEWLRFGHVDGEPSYFYSPNDPQCPYPHRRRVKWSNESLRRGGFSVPFQSSIKATLTVFSVSQREEFLSTIGQGAPVQGRLGQAYDPYRAVLDQLLQLKPEEFEILVSHLLTALGFEASEVTGKSGDGGVDATGELNVANLAKVKIFVQAKRYQIGHNVPTATVRQLRQAIPRDGQGAFITTSDYQRGAAEIALDPNFPRIGLVNGRQLVDLLIEHWSDIPDDFRDLLGLKPGLVKS